MVETDFARYGDVTSIEGFNQYGVTAKVKSFLTRSLLLRSEGRIRRRSYKFFNYESYNEAEIFVRLDKFHNSGTTIRTQIEAGTRRYHKEPYLHESYLYGLRTRIARSLGER